MSIAEALTGHHDVIDLCTALIRFDTTNRGGGDAEGEREAAEFVAERLAEGGLTEPVLLEREPRRTNVVARVRGTEPDRDAVLVQAHLDVVPADATGWSVPPFGGELRDGFVWGRGAADMKDMCAMMLSVAHGWAVSGRRPRRDVVFAFVADEEDRGDAGANWLASQYSELFAGCAVAIGEGGGFAFPVDGVRLYPVATAERGTAHFRVTARGRAGHASRENEENAVGSLVDALARLRAHRWPVSLTPSVRAFIERTGAALGVAVDLDDLDVTLPRLGRAATLVQSAIRISTTPTVLRAGTKVNVIPGIAEGLVDARLLPGSEETFRSTVDRLLGPQVTWEFLTSFPAVQAPVGGPWFDAMAAALQAVDPQAVVVPYCMPAGTDAKAFSQLGIDCYGFTPLPLPADFDYPSMAHGVDERVPIDALINGTQALDHFLSTC